MNYEQILKFFNKSVKEFNKFGSFEGFRVVLPPSFHKNDLTLFIIYIIILTNYYYYIYYF